MQIRIKTEGFRHKINNRKAVDKHLTTIFKNTQELFILLLLFFERGKERHVRYTATSYLPVVLIAQATHVN